MKKPNIPDLAAACVRRIRASTDPDYVMQDEIERVLYQVAEDRGSYEAWHEELPCDVSGSGINIPAFAVRSTIKSGLKYCECCGVNLAADGMPNCKCAETEKCSNCKACINHCGCKEKTDVTF